jgi:tol-pal system protein YbgF
MQMALKHVIAVALLSSLVTVAFGEDAPVYEVDNYPPAFDRTQDNLASDSSYDASSGGDGMTPMSSLPPEQRLARLEQQLKNVQSSSSAAKIDALQREIASLRGQVEELTHQLKDADTRQRAMFADLDKRLVGGSTVPPPLKTDTPTDPTPLATVSASPKPPEKPVLVADNVKKNTDVQASIANTTVTPPPKPVLQSQPNVLEEQQIYQTAYDLIKSKKYNEAVSALQKMLQRYPSGQFAANAHYWLGELYGLLNKNDASANEFAIVVKKYPDSPKVSDAELKLGFIYLGQFKWTEAKAVFKNVVNRYPGTASARTAAEQLKQIKKSGH